MRLVMGVSPRSPEAAEKRHWTVTVIRAFGIVQIIGIVASSCLVGRGYLQRQLVMAFNMSYDSSLIVSLILSIAIGLGVGFLASVATFAVAMLLDDVHTIRNYLRDIHISGQFYDE